VADLVWLCASSLSKSNEKDGNLAQSAIGNLLFLGSKSAARVC
jgi:hypothetical protein